MKEKEAMRPSAKTKAFPLIFIAIIIILIVLSFMGIAGVDIRGIFAGGISQYNYDHMMMDTFVTISLFSADGKDRADEAAQKAFAEMERLETMLHRNTIGSDIWKINEKAGISPVAVSDETIYIINKAIFYSELTNGAFDISIAPLVDLWGFGQENNTVPSPSGIEEILPLIDYRKITVNNESREVFLEKEGMALDLGGIAKGFIVDSGIEVLKENGIEKAFLNAGGDIRLMGGKPENEPWVVGIKNPRNEGGTQQSMTGKISLFESAVVTSGDYQRFFEEDGRRYHHIINPADGYPAEGLLSVTIVHRATLDADILSTAVFIMGREKGLELIRELTETEAVLIHGDLIIDFTAGLDDVFEKITE